MFFTKYGECVGLSLKFSGKEKRANRNEIRRFISSFSRWVFLIILLHLAGSHFVEMFSGSREREDLNVSGESWMQMGLHGRTSNSSWVFEFRRF